MKLPGHLVGRSFLVVVAAVTLYACTALYLGWDSIREQVQRFPGLLLAAMAGLSLVNYLLRYWRWEIYLKDLDCPLPRRHSLGLYFAAYVMVITPGKIGEVFKAGIMREKHGISLAKGIPVVLAERIYDFLAVLILACLGVFFWPGTFAGLTTGLVAAGTVPVALYLFRNPAIRSRLLAKLGQAPVLRHHALTLDESLTSLGILLRPAQMGFSLVLTVLAWLAECLGLWLACRGLDFALTVPEATFTYAAGTLVGSLSFLPGGLGGTEATIIFLLRDLTVDLASAATVAFLVRLFTLWLAVLIGLGFFLVFRRELLGKNRPD